MAQIPTGRLALAAGMLAALAADNVRRSASARAAYPPRGRFVDVEGGRIHAIDDGEGPPVVLIHGAGVDHSDMAMTLLGPLKRRYRVLAVDRPGIGHSTRPRGWAAPDVQARMLHEAVTALGIRFPIVVGHSFGAAVAMTWALQFPEDTAGVVFLSGYVYPTTRPDFLPFMAPAAPLIGPVLAHTVLPPVDRLMLPFLMKRVFAPQPVPDGFRHYYPADFILQPSQLIANGEDIASLIPAANRLSPHWHEVAVPVCILAGTEDRLVAPEHHAVRLSNDIPDATFQLYPGIGHMLHHFRTGDVIDAVDEIAERADLRARSAALGWASG
ncbi:MAG TPA: alpha/beta hydrolase [Azospirillaceae bacterium]|nr:alpha/beta hydrolase [Azospirillaceae bacterium]